jgi:hypothetical protein
LVARTGHDDPRSFAVEDSGAVMLEGAHCPLLSLQMDYYNRPGRRWVMANTATKTAMLDMTGRSFSVGDEMVSIDVNRDDTYKAQLMAILGDEHGPLATFDEGLSVVRLIGAIETSAQRQAWVQL